MDTCEEGWGANHTEHKMEISGLPDSGTGEERSPSTDGEMEETGIWNASSPNGLAWHNKMVFPGGKEIHL